MTIKGRWRIVQMPDYEADYLDMMEPAYILFESDGALNREICFHRGDEVAFIARPWPTSSTAC